MSHLGAIADYEDYDITDWDGDGAEPITPATLAHARAIYAAISPRFPLPVVCPAADGTICAEWDRRRATAFLWLDVAEDHSSTLHGRGSSMEERRWLASEIAALVAYINDALAKVYAVEATWTQAALDEAAEAAKKMKTAFNRE